MEYTVRKMRDANGNLKDELDPIRARYDFPVLFPPNSSNNYIEIPDGKVFYMDTIDVENTDSANAHKFHIEDDSGNALSIEYKLASGEVKTITIKTGALSGKIHFVQDTYGKLKYRVSGYMDNAD